MEANFRVEHNRLIMWTEVDELLNDPTENLISKPLLGLTTPGQSEFADVNEIALPFFYWRSEDRSRLPVHLDVLNAGKPYEDQEVIYGNNPTIAGRIILPFGKTLQAKNVIPAAKRAFSQLQKQLEKNTGYKSFLFKLCIPISTRTLSDTIKSLFPFYIAGQCSLRITSEEKNLFFQTIYTVVGVALDILTSPLRLATLIPRWGYQHVLQQSPRLPENVKFEDRQGNAINLDLSCGFLTIKGIDVYFENHQDIMTPSDHCDLYLGS